MFINSVTKKQMVAAISVGQQAACAYRATPCDCKYARDGELPTSSLSESGNGCPELRVAVLLVDALTPHEFDRVMKRVRRAEKRDAVRRAREWRRSAEGRAAAKAEKETIPL